MHIGIRIRRSLLGERCHHFLRSAAFGDSLLEIRQRLHVEERRHVAEEVRLQPDGLVDLSAWSADLSKIVIGPMRGSCRCDSGSPAFAAEPEASE
jgi:hypothetical protein